MSKIIYIYTHTRILLAATSTPTVECDAQNIFRSFAEWRKERRKSPAHHVGPCIATHTHTHTHTHTNTTHSDT